MIDQEENPGVRMCPQCGWTVMCYKTGRLFAHGESGSPHCLGSGTIPVNPQKLLA